MTSKVDYKNHDYKSFIFVLHEEYGLLLLHCTRKKNKPPHWQLPGGHVDENDFVITANENDTYETQLTKASKMGAARELYEETGIDIRIQQQQQTQNQQQLLQYDLERLKPAGLRSSPRITKMKNPILVNEYKQRLFYFLMVTNHDFIQTDDGIGGGGGGGGGRITKAIGEFPVQLKLSIEHSGFTFQSDPNKAADMLIHHSGGKTSEALRMSMLSITSPLSAKKATMKGIPTSVQMTVPFLDNDDNDDKNCVLELPPPPPPPPTNNTNNNNILEVSSSHTAGSGIMQVEPMITVPEMMQTNEETEVDPLILMNHKMIPPPPPKKTFLNFCCFRC